MTLCTDFWIYNLMTSLSYNTNYAADATNDASNNDNGAVMADWEPKLNRGDHLPQYTTSGCPENS